MQQIQTSKTASRDVLKKAKVSFNSKGVLQEVSTGSGDLGQKTAASSSRQTRQNLQEQGDKKQFSPEAHHPGLANTVGGKPPLKRKKSGGGHSHTNS